MAVDLKVSAGEVAVTTAIRNGPLRILRLCSGQGNLPIRVIYWAAQIRTDVYVSAQISHLQHPGKCERAVRHQRRLIRTIIPEGAPKE